MSNNDALFLKPIAIKMTKTYHILGTLIVALLPLFASILGGMQHQFNQLLAGIIGVMLVFFVGLFLMKRLPILVKASSEGLYIHQYRRLFPWSDIKSIYVIDMNQRSFESEQPTTSTAKDSSLRLPMLIGIEFTERGYKKYGSLCDSLWQRKHTAYSDHAVIRTHFFAFEKGRSDSIPHIVQQCELLRLHH